MSQKVVKQSITPLPYPVTFICRYPERWAELFSSEVSISDPEHINHRFVNAEDCWIIQTYLRLKQNNYNVFLSDRFIPGEICIVSSLDLKIKDLSFSSFVVGCRADGPKPTLCNFAIVQNETCVESQTDAFVPHWPQPGLIRRNQTRGTRIENIVFKGSELNLYEPFKSSEFLQKLENLGVRLQVSGKTKELVVSWNDYSDADLVLAVRDLTEKDALVKPASKLVNAWMAGVPALLGPEPAFRQLRQSELDYIEIKTPNDVINAIRHLKEEPERYEKMIANGFNRAKDFTVERIAEQWQEILTGPVAQRYHEWRLKPKISHLTDFVFKAIQQKKARSEAVYHRKHGYRIISGQHT
ncbi:glycosyltransferase [Mastigocoleus testarum]|uniref:Spore protein YkvP/CgeB glycosyl transferase-like domain-containing protein n=1 Tax=Mastigocoleus testarum BC008 TaxID=371196 RepID=A0A0V7ZCP6_9CYAN|nr:glycosyltransferase [Mastigocoleus testarum]KST62302.1 hypothetical protein BC008_09015 [Mastigocoleus testarum BC008]KST70273.1 hypothetical protein BC008_37165 [Mastigocoleus testarum BC008]